MKTKEVSRLGRRNYQKEKINKIEVQSKRLISRAISYLMRFALRVVYILIRMLPILYLFHNSIHFKFFIYICANLNRP